MSDFAYAYFNSELDKLDIPSLEGIYEKVQKMEMQKTFFATQQTFFHRIKTYS